MTTAEVVLVRRRRNTRGLAEDLNSKCSAIPVTTPGQMGKVWFPKVKRLAPSDTCLWKQLTFHCELQEGNGQCPQRELWWKATPSLTSHTSVSQFLLFSKQCKSTERSKAEPHVDTLMKLGSSSKGMPGLALLFILIALRNFNSNTSCTSLSRDGRRKSRAQSTGGSYPPNGAMLYCPVWATQHQQLHPPVKLYLYH